MSGRDAWMPLYVADYLADTAMLTMEQSGAYLHLLMQYYRTGPLPDDDIKLATICRTTRTHFVRHIGPAVRPFFTAADGRLHQKRADLERQKRQDISAARAAAGAKSRGKLAENMPNFAAETGENLFPDLNENNSLTLANAGTKPAVLLVDAVPAETVRGTRLRQDWQPSADEVAYALNEGLDAERIAADFRDHWCSKTGKDATKLNWSMTWQKWCRTAADRRPKRAPDSQSGLLLPLAGTPTRDRWGIQAWLAKCPDVRMGTVGNDVGQRLLHGYYAEALLEDLALAARLPPEQPVDWTALAEWLNERVANSDQIEAAFRRVAGRAGYRPPRSIRFFDGAVREQRQRGAA